MLVEKYAYPTLKRVTAANGTRQYTGEDNQPVPSVTTILSATGDKTALINWRNRVGDAEANRVSQESAGLGTKVHNALEKYILEEKYDITGNNLISIMAKRMVDSMINEGFTDVDEIWGTEVGLIANGLYAGTSDAIGIHNGQPAIIDFKTSKKLKKSEWIKDYIMQGSAYALAHNEMFQTDIKKIVILMVDRDANHGEYIIEGDEFTEYCGKWASRVTEYYSKLT